MQTILEQCSLPARHRELRIREHAGAHVSLKSRAYSAATAL
jgi:hypothetical protein